METGRMIIFYVLLGLALIYLLIGLYFYNISLNAKTDKTSVMEGNRSVNGFDNDKNENAWFDENSIETSIKSNRGEKLVAYKFINEKSKDWVIVVHGYLLSGREMSLYTKKFYQMGYNVLTLDLLGHGNSQGKTISMGGFDSDNLVLWAEKLNEEYPDAKIILFGISMGAATVLNSLGKGLPASVSAFIEDSGYIRLEEIFSHQLKKLYGLPKFLVIPPASLMTKLIGGYSFKEVDATQGIKDTKLPGLLIHGDKDGFVPVENVNRVYELMNSRKEKHIFTDSIHCQGPFKYPEEYWSLVENFLKTLDK